MKLKKITTMQFSRNFLLLTLFCTSFFAGHSQVNLNLNIQHLLGSEEMELGKQINSTDGHPFEISRLQYYISQISVFHDNGKQTKVKDTWALITTGNKEQTTIELGEYDMTQVDKIIFHVGVEEEVNHDDPALWPADHPLAPKNPSMHWGWVGGYRFVAMEGLCGASMNETFQMHSVGNEIYTTVQVEVDEQATDGFITVDLKADYIRTLDGIDASKGFIQHGALNEAEVMMANFGDFVFTDAKAVVSSEEIDLSITFDAYPNPVVGGFVNVTLAETSIDGLQYKVFDGSGKIISSQAITQRNFKIEIPSQSQVYFLQILDGSQRVIGSKALTVQ